jgi:hypothetical protein
MSKAMRAKVVLNRVEQFASSEKLVFNPVCAKAYGVDGVDEDNTYARFSPSGEFQLSVTNPELLGQFKPGEKYYVDFTPVAAD